MIGEKFSVPPEVTALIHHIELNKAGWWDKAVQRLVLSTIWMAGKDLSSDEIKESLGSNFQLSLSSTDISKVITWLLDHDFLLEISGGSLRIPETKRNEFSNEISAADIIRNNAKAFFLEKAASINTAFNSEDVWNKFDKFLVTPLVNETGANAYNLMVGDLLTVDRQIKDQFLSHFPKEQHEYLLKIVKLFLDPKNEKVRTYISRLLHARFCIDAIGLPEDVLKKVNNIGGRQIQFNIFADTNFLFSVLGLHYNPSDTTASDLRDLIMHLKGNVKIKLLITPMTIAEAKRSIIAAKGYLHGVPKENTYSRVALLLNSSGIAAKFLTQRLEKNGELSAEDWFAPYLSNFVQVARDNGIELFNENLEGYGVRKDVMDDIVTVLEAEKSRPEDRRKSYDKVEHDMILWHLVKDRRTPYIESPIDAQDWILTLDYRLISFDGQKQRQNGNGIPVCLHPSSFIQLLQFWVPRSKEFEEAMLDSLRLPFLMQEFNVEAERTTLRILKGLGRFENNSDFSEETIMQVVLNEGLRERIGRQQPEEEDIPLIKDALVTELGKKAQDASSVHVELEGIKSSRDVALQELAVAKKTGEIEAQKLKGVIESEKDKNESAKLVIQRRDKEIEELKTKFDSDLLLHANHLSFLKYQLSVSALVVITTILIVYIYFSLINLSIGQKFFILSFCLLLILTSGVVVVNFIFRRNEYVSSSLIKKKITKGIKLLWFLVVLGIIIGVLGNLLTDIIKPYIATWFKHSL